jgi:DnaJ-class molecular chaperone
MDRDKALKLLNLQNNATLSDVKNAFHELSKKYHPDKNPDGIAHEAFILIQQAYQRLISEEVPYSTETKKNEPHSTETKKNDFIPQEWREMFGPQINIFLYKRVKLAQVQKICNKYKINLMTISSNTHKPIRKTKEELLRSIIKLPQYLRLSKMNYDQLTNLCQQHNISINDAKDKSKSLEEMIMDLMEIE